MPNYVMAAIVAALIFWGGYVGKYSFSTVRGVRLNNPLNIRINNANDWLGKVYPSSDPEFEQFESAAYGFRAAGKTLQTYQRAHGLNTISQMVSRFAPPVENKTQNYINFVSQKTGIGAHQEINTENHDQLARIVHAMSIMEVGHVYSLDDAKAGINLI